MLVLMFVGGWCPGGSVLSGMHPQNMPGKTPTGYIQRPTGVLSFPGAGPGRTSKESSQGNPKRRVWGRGQ